MQQVQSGLLLLSLSLLFSMCLCAVPHHHGGGHKDGKERAEDGAYSPRDTHHKHGGEDHDAAFDHEAILGSAKEAEAFDELSPAEAKKRLRVLLGKMDRNHDGLIDRKELFSWILRSFKSLSAEESLERLKDADADGDGLVTWDEHRAEEYDLDLDEEDADAAEERLRTDPDRLEELNMLEEDRILFTSADANQDGRLDKDEFLGFSHPEEVPSMHDTVVRQALKQKDADGDGRIDFKEYVGERGRDQNKEWIVSEKERFDTDLDKDGDGSLDRQEILHWMIPSNEDIAQEEVDHLFAGADDDVSGELTFDEVLAHHDLFVGSEATDYGEHLNRLDKFGDEL